MPLFQPRRLRYNPILRNSLSEIHLRKNELIQPIFLHWANKIKKEITTMPGIYQLSLDEVYKMIENYLKIGLNKFILFGIPKEKDEIGGDALNKNGIMGRGIRGIKKRFPEAFIISDLCFCEYTSHGHCGVIKDNQVHNELTIDNLAKQSLFHAQWGVDMVAPSAMMDNMVWAIRKILDENNYKHLPILSYAVKFSSSLYGPFREAVDSAPQFGDRSSYQLNYQNQKEGLKEAIIDLEEGADLIMVKPALAYLDLISLLYHSPKVLIPLVAYQVSGEYSMLKFAAKAGAIDEKKAVLETLTSIRRAGAKLIISYYSYPAIKWLEEEK